MCVTPVQAMLLAKARMDAETYLPRPRVTGVPWSRELEAEWQELKRAWAREDRQVKPGVRCWAVLRDGSQCARRAADAGVCETHAYMGCRLPGLGWRGGEPQGRIVVRRGGRKHEQAG